MKVYIASDHGGFKLKEKLREYLESFRIDVEDMGPNKLITGDDYPDYTFPLAAKVAADVNSFGILMCRNGAGVNIAANKVSGIRASLSFSVKHAESIRKDDNTNILCLPSDYLSVEEALKIAGVWLNTEFSGAERHVRRMQKIKNFEENE